jgi:hypothetical protein
MVHHREYIGNKDSEKDRKNSYYSFRVEDAVEVITNLKQLKNAMIGLRHVWDQANFGIQQK